jgi:hypothetical protein
VHQGYASSDVDAENGEAHWPEIVAAATCPACGPPTPGGVVTGIPEARRLAERPGVVIGRSQLEGAVYVARAIHHDRNGGDALVDLVRPVPGEARHNQGTCRAFGTVHPEGARRVA